MEDKEEKATRKIAFVDLDGTVCNSEKRFAKAYRNGRINYQIAFQPDLLELDELLTHAPAVLERLESDGWEIIYLSSRPEMLHRSTRTWLKTNHLLTGKSGEREIILKPAKYRFSSSAKWKAEVICKWAGRAGEILFIDDENENILVARGLWSENGNNRELFKTYKSLELILGGEEQAR